MISFNKRFNNAYARICLAALICLLFNIVSRFPGIGNPDSDHQYHEAINGHYTDWHPPIMAWVWSFFRLFLDGNQTLFIIHITIYWFGFWLIAISLVYIKKNISAWLIILTGLFPPFLMLDVQILKDVGMAVCFLAGFALCFWSRTNKARMPICASIAISILILYGILVRSNGILAAGPILIYAFYPNLLSRPLRVIVCCFILCAVTFPVSNIINYYILGARQTHPLRSLEIFDIAGISYFSKDPKVMGEESALTEKIISDCYTPILWDTLSWGAKCHIFWDHLALSQGPQSYPENDKQRILESPPNPNLTQLWLSAISEHPTAYLQHRVAHFNSEMYFIEPNHHADFRVMNKMVYGTTFDDLEFKNLKWRVMDDLRYNPLSTPLFFLIVGLMTLSLTWPTIQREKSNLIAAAFCLSLSSTIYTCGYFLIGVASDVRYQFWSMLSAVIGVIFYISNRSSHKSFFNRIHLIYIALLIFVVISLHISREIEGDALYISYENFLRDISSIA